MRGRGQGLSNYAATEEKEAEMDIKQAGRKEHAKLGGPGPFDF